MLSIAEKIKEYMYIKDIDNKQRAYSIAHSNKSGQITVTLHQIFYLHFTHNDIKYMLITITNWLFSLGENPQTDVLILFLIDGSHTKE